MSSWFASGRPMSAIHQSKLLKMIKTDLSLHSHRIKTGALNVLGTGTHVLSAHDRSLANNIMTMINRHTKNQGMTLQPRNWIKFKKVLRLKGMGGIKLWLKVYRKHVSFKSNNAPFWCKIRSKLGLVNKKSLKLLKLS